MLWQTQQLKRHNGSSSKSLVLDVMLRTDDVIMGKYVELHPLFRMHKSLSHPADWKANEFDWVTSQDLCAQLFNMKKIPTFPVKNTVELSSS